MSRPRFSVVIPTRNAEKTLKATLRTCVEQEFEDYEIVVSDNSSTPATEALLADMGSPRIRRVRPERTLPMQENWEFAVEQAQGEYILVVGSDDGLLPHALKELDRILRMLNVKLLRWTQVCYNWPDMPVQEQLAPNTLLLPLKQTHFYHPIRWQDSRHMMLEVVNGAVNYAELPMVYASAVHRDLFAALRRSTGRVFHSDCPDIYSGFALAHLLKRYCTLDAPISISGLSGVSNGVATIFLKERSPIAEDFKKLNLQQRSGRDWPEWIPDVPLLSTCTAHSFQCARAALFPDDTELVVDRRHLTRAVMSEYRSEDEPEWQRLRDRVRRTLMDDLALLEWFDAEYGDKSLATCPPAPVPQMRRYGGPYMQLDAAEFGVADVWGAALLCEKLLGYKRDGLNAHLQPGQSALTAAGSTVPHESASTTVMAAPRDGLYQQETEVAVLKILAGKVKRKTFLDVGAEKGSFARELMVLGFSGVLFEPFTGHLPALNKLVEGTDSRVLSCAVDATDHEGRLHIAKDEEGQPLEYFHSLQAAPSATNFRHDAEGVPVACRSLESLAREGTIEAQVGILKVDTEGNDLRVLEGMGPVRAEVLMCEFVTPRLYPDWICSFPEGLMAAAKAMGYGHCLAVSRFDEHEIVEVDPVHFVDGEWGNLIFTSKGLLDDARAELDALRAKVQAQHVRTCLKGHRELLEKEAMIQQQAVQLLEKEAMIQQQARTGEAMRTILDKNASNVQALQNKITALKEKVEGLKGKLEEQKEKNLKLRGRSKQVSS
ncbi:FkbM family methyltransferase [Roseimicrobium sp. ORNL1]|uniref:FkbM family methyltransferase n=1 Tax=Roseimicrobium sp. ORNL1 TaxID=2711231 RepID=UPI0013E11C31|nr:FkbM family methyltransferase [Roseimicrobium sp. ORNL1]QIF00136.1 FkbM family methyltransferase [Roseimicrobium sp. ORNL1]